MDLTDYQRKAVEEMKKRGLGDEEIARRMESMERMQALVVKATMPRLSEVLWNS